MDRPENDVRMERAVLEYLAEQPQAADTLVGIADWWLTLNQVKVAIASLQRVLNGLVAKGVLEIVGDGQQACYRLKR